MKKQKGDIQQTTRNNTTEIKKKPKEMTVIQKSDDKTHNDVNVKMLQLLNHHEREENNEENKTVGPILNVFGINVTTRHCV